MSSFEEQQKALYRDLTPCLCVAIGEVVHFNAEGLRHLLYKENRPRKQKERHYRLALIPHIRYAILHAKKAKKSVHADQNCELWVLEWVETKTTPPFKVKVVLRRIGNGRVHFLSIMQKRNGRRNTSGSNKKARKNPVARTEFHRRACRLA